MKTTLSVTSELKYHLNILKANLIKKEGKFMSIDDILTMLLTFYRINIGGKQ